MQVHQSGQQRHAGKIDDFGIDCVSMFAPTAAMRFAAYQNGPALMRVAVGPDARGAEKKPVHAGCHASE